MGTVAVHGLCKSFGKVQALDGVTLDVPDGSFFVVLGPSGAGKTTTLRAIAGLEKLDAGSVHLDGRDATGDAPAARDLAMVFQNYALYPRHTVYENIASPLRARRCSSSEIAAAVEQMSSLLHIERLLQRRPAQLSGGEMQRVALARALVRRPRAFLMDEPLTNLDLKLRVEMRTELTRIHRSLGATFVYVTNDQVEALSMADQVAVLKEGKVQQVGTPTEVYERPANQWVAGFVGSPPISLLACHAEGDRLVGAEGWTLPRPRWTTARTVVRCCWACARRTCPSSSVGTRRCRVSSTGLSRSVTERWSTSEWGRRSSRSRHDPPSPVRRASGCLSRSTWTVRTCSMRAPGCRCPRPGGNRAGRRLAPCART